MDLDWPVILINLGVWNQTNEETYLEIENKYSKYYTLHTYSTSKSIWIVCIGS